MESKWKEFCESWLADEPDVLTVFEIKRITGYCKSSVQGWADCFKYDTITIFKDI